MDGWVDGWVDEWMGGRVGGWVGGWAEGFEFARVGERKTRGKYRFMKLMK